MGRNRRFLPGRPTISPTTMHTMAYNGSQVNIAEIYRNWQSWVSARFLLWTSRWAGRQWQKMVENGRKWSKIVHRGYLVENGFSRVSRRGHRGGQVGNGRKWQEMAGNGLPRLFGRKWIFAHLSPFPYYLNIVLLVIKDDQAIQKKRRFVAFCDFVF